MPNSFDFLHIKRHTAGSSNELSFDVLDAARSQLDGKSQKTSRSAKTPNASKGSYHGVAGTSTLSAIPEVERRKKQRHARAVRVRVLGALIIVIAVGALAFAGYGFYQSRVDFSDRFATLVSSVDKIDESLVEVDEVMGDPLSGEAKEQVTEQLSELDGIAEQLDDMSDDVNRSLAFAMGDADMVALTQLNQAVEGRKNMVSAARAALSVANQYYQEQEVATTAWNNVLNADQLAREATALANSATTDEATEAARQKTLEAYYLLADAKEALEGLGYRHEKVDFSAQLEYLDKRMQALDYAVATSDALIAGDRGSAIANNDAYNAADQEAARLAADLPLLVNDQVKVAFESEIAPAITRYEAFRSDVAEADADVRAYLER